MACEAVELLGFKRHSDHEDLVAIHLSDFRQSSVVKTSSVSYSVAVFHESHKRHNDDLRPHLPLVFCRLGDTKQPTFYKLIPFVELSEDEWFVVIDDNRQGVVEWQVRVPDQLLHHGHYIHLELQWVV